MQIIDVSETRESQADIANVFASNLDVESGVWLPEDFDQPAAPEWILQLIKKDRISLVLGAVAYQYSHPEESVLGDLPTANLIELMCNDPESEAFVQVSDPVELKLLQAAQWATDNSADFLMDDFLEYKFQADIATAERRKVILERSFLHLSGLMDQLVDVGILKELVGQE